MDRKRKKKKRTEKKGGKRKEKTRGKHSGLRLWCFSYFLVGWKCDCQSSQRRLAASSDCVLAAGAGYCQRVVVVVGHGFGWGQSVPSYRGWGFAGTWWMFTGCFGVGCMASVHTARAVQLHLSMDGQYKLGCYGSYVSECGGW